MVRNSCLEVFCKKGLLKNFAKFTGKHLCQNLFFNKVADLRPATLFKKRFWHRCFPVNFAKFLRNTNFYRTPLDNCFWLKNHETSSILTRKGQEICSCLVTTSLKKHAPWLSWRGHGGWKWSIFTADICLVV